MIPKFREWDKERHETDYQEGMSYGERKDYDMGFTIWFSHIEDLDLINNDGTIDRIVMMSTGLKDKNGVEIFEDDIVRIKSSDGVDYKALIIFKDGGFCAVDGMNDDYSTRRYQLHKGDFELEIIGNKYEHPHLLRSDGEWK